MRSLATVILFLLANWAYAGNVSQIASEMLLKSTDTISKIEMEQNKSEVEFRLIERLKLNSNFVAILSQEDFSDHEVNSISEFQHFSQKILEEQEALLYIVNVMFFIASSVGLSYEEIVQHHTALKEDWNNLVSRKTIDQVLAKSLVDLTFYKGLNDKYKALYAI